jgi:2,3-bisphosphoglycerate-dependent phosphoglycerate mutase
VRLKTLYLIRHAHPKQGTGIPYDRPPGPELDEQGQTEANAAAAYLTHCGLQLLLTSPLERTRQTAQAIEKSTGITALAEAALAEHRSDENFESVKTRVRDLLDRLDANGPAVAGLVTHGSPIKAALQLLSNEQLDLKTYDFPGGNHAPTAGIWCAGRTDTGWSLTLVFEPSKALRVES